MEQRWLKKTLSEVEKDLLDPEDITNKLIKVKIKNKIKAKDLQRPWITNGIKISFKCKQHLYNKFLENRNEQNEIKYKNCKNVFEAIKNVLKTTTYSN